MLTQLSIQNFAIVDHLDIELQTGMTAITGETGAGKSIMLDALGLTLGERADSSVIPADKQRADISACFTVANNSRAQRWLEQHDLHCPENTEKNPPQECLLRRVITREGRSRAWIQGQPVTLQQLREFSQLLIDIHSQHEHHSLLHRDSQRHLLDAYAGNDALCREVREAYNQWQQTRQLLEQLRTTSDDNDARLQLLQYQVEELDALALQPGEVEQLELEQKQLASAGELLTTGEALLSLCSGENHTDSNSSDFNNAANISDQLSQALALLGTQQHKTSHLLEVEKLLQSAHIQVEEACNEIHLHQQTTPLDPQRLHTVEERLSTIYQVARKHRIATDEIVALHEKLNSELEGLSSSDEKLEQLERQQTEYLVNYQRSAAKLTEQRNKAAAKLSRAVNRELTTLNMKGCKLTVALSPRDEPHRHGAESLELLIKTNPGQPLQPLKKIASGGELSRISLAIQVVTVQTSAIPSLVFDEVDVGIGGETAAHVGTLLRKLGDKGQVLCVTHQAAVAAKAHQHITVSKAVTRGKTRTCLHTLADEERVDEVARMIGGAHMCEQSRAHAEVMLQTIN